MKSKMLSFKDKKLLLLKAAKTNDGIRHIMECMPIFSKNELVFDTIQKYRNDGAMLVLVVSCFSVEPFLAAGESHD